MYFCGCLLRDCMAVPNSSPYSQGFLAFTTTGYGDFAPASPAGRSIFVVWALMGVATMTILIAGMRFRQSWCIDDLPAL